MKGIEKLKRKYPWISEDITNSINSDQNEKLRTVDSVRNMIYRWQTKNILSKNKEFLTKHINIVLERFWDKKVDISELD